MKRYLIPGIGTAILLASCSQNQPVPPAHATGGVANGYTLPKEASQSRQYLALPGQSARPVAPSDTDDAFERQAAAYATGRSDSPQTDPGFSAMDDPQTGAAQTGAPLPLTDSPAMPPATTDTSDIPEPSIIQNPDSQQTPATEPSLRQELATTPPAATSNTTATTADYAVQVTNGTVGRLFVEVQDDSGNVFPIAFMHAGQNISTPPMEPKPIVGKLTVVVRDPDQPNAPELRRYKVNPPAQYSGKTVGITILPGGQYRASLDGEVYYTSPAPTPPGQSGDNQ